MLVNIRFKPNTLTENEESSIKELLHKKMKLYGDFNFNDDVWFCSNLKKDADHDSKYTLKFDFVRVEHKQLLKFYALLENKTIKTINQKIKDINEFLNFLYRNFPNLKLKQVNKKIISLYEQYLQESDVSDGMKRHLYASIQSFFSSLIDFDDMPNTIPTKHRNPFKDLNYKLKNKEKYIPTEVVKQLDVIMKDEKTDIPASFRLLYWIQRSFPNRLTEVCSIKENALKSYYSYFVLQIPTTKQNGGNIRSEIKTIPIINNGHGKYIINLIKKVEDESQILKKYYEIDDLDKKYLILNNSFSFAKNDNRIKTKYFNQEYLAYIELKEKGFNNTRIKNELALMGFKVTETMYKSFEEKSFKNRYTKLYTYTIAIFNKHINNLIKLYDIRDEKGNLYKISSHKFRHNATTDRLYIGGYTLDQVRTLRHDKGENMVMQYVHQQKEFHKEMWEKSTKLTSVPNAPVEFKGKIMNLDDERVINRITKNPNSYLTWEVNGKKGVGICSSISGCNPSGTSVHFECYECNWFVPKAEFLNDYIKELDYWKHIMNSTANDSKRAAHFENAIRNVNILERIILICRNGIENHKKAIKDKVKEGDM